MLSEAAMAAFVLGERVGDGVEDGVGEEVGVLVGVAVLVDFVATPTSYVKSVRYQGRDTCKQLRLTLTLEYFSSSILSMGSKLQRCPFCGARISGLIAMMPLPFLLRWYSVVLATLVKNHVLSPQDPKLQKARSLAISPLIILARVLPSVSSSSE